MYKSKNIRCMAIASMILALSGCGAFTHYDEVREIKASETAVLIQLTGDTMKGQKTFMSEEFLAANKVATKRVIIPTEKIQGEYRPTMALLIVDRSPITREWTALKTTGTSTNDQAISVESSESIDFKIGVTMTASIPETMAIKYLYNYGDKKLADIADSNIRGFVQAGLANEFGSRTLLVARAEKKQVFEKVLADARAHYAQLGISIDVLGFSDGMTYTDPKIQESINNTFNAEMGIKKAELEKQAQEQRNIQKVETAKADREAAEEFAKAQQASVAQRQLDIELIKANAQLEFAKRVSGNLPNIINGGSPLMMGLGLDGTPVPKK